MIRRPPRSTPKPSSAASDVYKRQRLRRRRGGSSRRPGDFRSLHRPRGNRPGHSLGETQDLCPGSTVGGFDVLARPGAAALSAFPDNSREDSLNDRILWLSLVWRTVRKLRREVHGRSLQLSGKRPGKSGPGPGDHDSGAYADQKNALLVHKNPPVI